MKDAEDIATLVDLELQRIKDAKLAHRISRTSCAALPN
jgi:hypothetical protein